MTRAAEADGERGRGDAVTGSVTERAGLLAGQGPLRRWFSTHRTASYFIRRFVFYLISLWGAITATFFFFRLIPGNPIGAYIQNLQRNYNYNVSASTAVVDHYKAVFGLDGNLFDQYLHYMYQLFIAHNMGPSLINYPDPAQVVIARAIPWTIGLLTIATVISWVLGVVLGAVVGMTRRSAVSQAATYASLAVTHIPYYFVAVILLFFVAYRFGFLPSEYAYGPSLQVGLSPGFIGSVLKHGLLPAISIVVVSALGNLLGMRQQMIMTLGEDYLLFATAKGLKPWRILRRYAMPNCYLPQVTGLLISFGFIFNGNVLIEQIFNYPGVGHLLVQSVQDLDLNTIMGITDVAIFVTLTAVFLVDMILPVLDPRITYSSSSR